MPDSARASSTFVAGGRSCELTARRRLAVRQERGEGAGSMLRFGAATPGPIERQIGVSLSLAHKAVPAGEQQWNSLMIGVVAAEIANGRGAVAGGEAAP